MTDPTPTLSASGMVRKLTELERRLEADRIRHSNGGRRVENVAMWVAILLIATRSIVELIQGTGILAHVDAGFPWGFWMTCGLLVLPKVVGRSSAGRFWESIGAGIGRRVGGGASGQNPIPDARRDDER